MSVYEPEAIPSLGNTKVVVTDSVADETAPSLATEINAATSEDLSLTIRDWNPTISENSGTAPRRLGTTTQMPLQGLSNYEPIEVRYPYDPQGDDTDPDNAAKAALVEGAVKDFVVRKGVDAETAFAVDDEVEVWSVRCGRQNRGRSGDDEFAEYEIVQMLYPLKAEEYATVVA